MKRNAKIKLLGAIFMALVMTIGLLPWTSTTVYATASYSDYENNPEKTVKFNGHDWYIIDDDSSAPNAGTVTLLSMTFLDASITEGATIEFDTTGTGNTAYGSSTLKSWIDSYYEEHFMNVDAAIRNTPISGQDTKLYPLSVDEAWKVNEGIRIGKHGPGFGDYSWWLRTAGTNAESAAYVSATANSSTVEEAGMPVKYRNHVRAALKLDLSRVSFDAETGEFTPVVFYIDYENGVRTEKICSNYTLLNEDTKFDASTAYDPDEPYDETASNYIGARSSNGEWIVIEGNVECPYRMRVIGNASIILKDSSTLNATKGIEVVTGNSLTIYSQTDAHMGKLFATATQGDGDYEECNAGIGGSGDNSAENCGTVTINGGIIFAQGGSSTRHAVSGAGIGGGYHGNGGTVRINGGTVTAVGGPDSAGIGEAFKAPTKGTVTVGGDVTVVKAGADESSAVDVTDSFASDHSQKWVHTESAPEKEPIVSRTVKFRVIYGSWDDGTSTEKEVTLNGFEGDGLRLSDDQIPKVGSNPRDGYKHGVWDVVPSTETEIEEDTIYTYTYAKDLTGPVHVTFRVVNGAWSNGLRGNVTVTLPKPNGDYVLIDWDIPTAGNKPADRSFKRGSWDKVPQPDSLIEEDTVYTYTYAKREMVTSKVTFSVEGGTWNDGTNDVREVTLSDYEGYPVRLGSDQIPEVGANPDSTHKKDGYWNMWPPDYVNTMGDMNFVYKYRARQPISHTVTFKVENGAWADGTTEDKTVTLTGLEGDTLKLAEDQIPKADTKPAENYIRGRWVTPGPSTNRAITEDVTYTYRYWDKSAAVPYLDWDEGQKRLVEKTGDDACDDFEIIDQYTSTFGNGKWYVAKESMELQSTRIAVDGVAHLIIEDGVTLQLPRGGIKVEEGSTLYIHSQSEESDAGSLVAKAQWETKNAGIGSDGGDSTGTACGTVVIDGAHVTAVGANGGAGIGGGLNSAGGTVIINGGTVTTRTEYDSGAYSGSSHGGAGIGGGENGAGGIITINGGSVTAQGDGGAAIGGGYGCAGGTITINGGTVNATTTNGNGASIGGGQNGAGGTITINGGTVNATSSFGAAIGGGRNAAGGNITIVGGSVSATSNNGGAGIGGGIESNGAGGTVAIQGGTVTAKSRDGSAIGGGYTASDNGTVTLSETMTVVAGEDENSATAISNADYTSNHTAKYMFAEAHDPVTYLDWDSTQGKLVEKTCTDYVYADKGMWGADGGWVVVRGNIHKDDRLSARSTSHLILMDGAKLTVPQGFDVPEGTTLNIYGQSAGTGALWASGPRGYKNAGIGVSTGGAVVINGGKINATGDDNAAGIGGGKGGACGTVTINGGEVTARGGSNAAGIGGGFEAAGGTVTINGGIVDASGSSAPGIGAGKEGSDQGTVALDESIFVVAGDISNPETDVTASFASKHNQKYVIAAKKDLVNYAEYRTWDATSTTFLNCICVNCTNITPETTVLEAGERYVVNGDVSVSDRIEVHGAVRLILKDGSTLTASKGITVGDGDSLTVYGQEGGTGKLVATGADGAAGIGLDSGAGTCGAVTIHGGQVVATGGQGGAGIGGGQGGSGGNVTVYGGTVKAAGTNAAGIGAGQGAGTHNALTLGKGMFLYGSESTDPEADLSNYVGKKNSDYVRNMYMVVNNAVPQHTHHYTYTTGDGDDTNALIATCMDEDCPDSYGNERHSVTLTINAPAALGAVATLDGLDSFNTATGNNLSAADIKYFRETDGTWAELDAAPGADAEGNCWATIGIVGKGGAKVQASIGWQQHDGIVFHLWTATDSLPASAGSYCLTRDVTLSQGWSAPDGTTNLCLNGQGIEVTKKHLTVSDANTLNLYDEHTGDAAGTVTANELVFEVTHSAAMNMYGGKIADCPGGSSGVELENSATFHMYGGEISNCYDGVYLHNSDTDSIKFVMHDGVITGSRSEGVHVEAGTFVMEKGTITNCNTGVDIVSSSAAFKLGGTNISPQITNNTCGVKLRDRNIVVEPGTTLADTARISVLRTDKDGTTQYLTPGPVITGLTVPEGVFSSDSKYYGVRLTSDGAEAYLLPVPIEPIEDVELIVGYTEGSIIATAEVDTDFFSKALDYEWYSCDSEGNKTSDTPVKKGTYNVVGDKFTSYSIEAGKTVGTTEYYFCEITAKQKYGGHKSVAKSNVVAVSVVMPKAVVATVTPNAMTYDGVEHTLASVEGEATGGTMWYALGENATEAPVFDGTSQNADKKWSTSIPAATNTGTYYVWYKAVADEEHSDTKPVCVEAVISPVDKTDLNNALTAAEAYYDKIKDTADYDAVAPVLKEAIDAAKAVATNDNVVAATVEDAAAAIDAAKADAEAAVKEIDDAGAADAASAVIDTLPQVDAVTADSKKAVEAARAAYDALTDDQKAKVTPDVLKRLTDAEAKLAVLQAMSEVSAKTGSGMTYTGNPIQLINAPATALPAGCAMEYAVTASSTAPGDAAYATSIPTATEAGTYYVWYRVAGDGGLGCEARYVNVSIAPKAAEATEGGPSPASGGEVGQTYQAAGGSYTVTGASTVSAAMASSKKSVTVPASVEINGRSYAVTEIGKLSCKKATTLTIGKNVKKIRAKALRGCPKLKTVIVKTKKLTKKTVKNSLKGSKVKTVKVKVGSKKLNKKYAKKYKKIFTKKNCGATVKVKA